VGGKPFNNTGRALQPDLTLLDWDLPVLRGEEVITTINVEFPGARFIVRSALSGDDSIQNAVRLGAKAYLCKDLLRRELLSAIRAVHQGHQYLPGKVAPSLKTTSEDAMNTRAVLTRQ